MYQGDLSISGFKGRLLNTKAPCIEGANAKYVYMGTKPLLIA